MEREMLRHFEQRAQIQADLGRPKIMVEKHEQSPASVNFVGHGSELHHIFAAK